MAYYLDLFSPDTLARFSASDRTISGFRVRQRNLASRVKPGDKLLCYLTKLSRWVGVLEVTSTAFEDATPIFTEGSDPFIVRFKVKPVVWLSPEQGLPIHDKAIWPNLSLTTDHSQETSRWTGFFRGSLNHLTEADGEFLEQRLVAQQSAPKPYPLTEQDRKALAPLVAKRPEGAVTVTVPDDAEDEADEEAIARPRESIKVQALLGRIGATMGFKVWLPANDRGAVLAEWPAGKGNVVDELPLNYDTTTLDTIERIDVLVAEGEVHRPGVRGRAHHRDLLGAAAHGGPDQPPAEHGDQAAHCGARQPAGEGPPRDHAAGVLAAGGQTAREDLHVPVLRQREGDRRAAAPLARQRLGAGRVRRRSGGRVDERHRHQTAEDFRLARTATSGHRSAQRSALELDHAATGG
jgi:predicted RNA-binding protein